MSYVFGMVVHEGGMWSNGEVELRKHKNLNEFINEAAMWLGANGGVFYKNSRCSGIIKKNVLKDFNFDKELDTLLDYNFANKRPNNTHNITIGLTDLVNWTRDHKDYMLVKFSVEYDVSYICIHKNDWRVLRNVRIKKDREFGDYIVVR